MKLVCAVFIDKMIEGILIYAVGMGCSVGRSMVCDDGMTVPTTPPGVCVVVEAFLANRSLSS